MNELVPVAQARSIEFSAFAIPLRVICIEYRAHFFECLPSLTVVLQVLQARFQVGGEIGIGILPVTSQRLLNVDTPGIQPLRGLPWKQGISLSDLRQANRKIGMPTLHLASQAFQCAGLSVIEEESSCNRPAFINP